MLFDNAKSNHAVLIKMQHQTNEDTDTDEKFYFPTQSTVAVQYKERGPCMFSTILEYRSDGHHGKSYKIGVTKMGCIITRTKDTL